METKSTAITPFMYDKTKINIRVTIKDKYNKRKQIRALMPNFIHSLDGGSLCLLALKFFNNYPSTPTILFSSWLFWYNCRQDIYIKNFISFCLYWNILG